MNETIICALIAGVSAVLGQYFISLKSKREDEVKDAIRDQRLEDRLNSVEKKLDIHNGYAEKFSDISISITGIRKDIDYLKKNLNKE